MPTTRRRTGFGKRARQRHQATGPRPAEAERYAADTPRSLHNPTDWPGAWLSAPGSEMRVGVGANLAERLYGSNSGATAPGVFRHERRSQPAGRTLGWSTADRRN